MTIGFCTFGCKLNQAETEEIKGKFKEKGWRVVSPFLTAVDVAVINACAVTQKAEKEVRQTIHRIKRLFPKSYLVVVGCFTEQMKIQERANVDSWIDNSRKEDLDKLILKELFDNKYSRHLDFKFQTLNSRQKKDRTRALIKIQSGCRRRCAYCIVPYLRKKNYSKPLRQVIREVKQKQKKGFKEFVLVGVDISQYNDRGKNLVDLLKEILRQTTILRVRLSSLWPTAISGELIDLIKNNVRICPHLHLSVQSASDEILSKMNRNYKLEELRKIIKKLKQIPGMNLTADVIVGFPGEREIDFKQTSEFIKWAEFLKVHIFKFSPRPGTETSTFEGGVLDEIKQKRSRILRKLEQKVSGQARKRYLNQTLPVLFEAEQNSYWSGLTANYLKIFAKSERNLTNQIIKVRLVGLHKDGIMGEIV